MSERVEALLTPVASARQVRFTSQPQNYFIIIHNSYLLEHVAVIYLVVAGVSICAVDCTERVVSEMMYYVLTGILNSALSVSGRALEQ